MTDTRFFVDGRAQLPRTDKPRGFMPKPLTEATLHERRVALAYERRSNRCRTCHTTRSLTGECLCTD